jgi:hypothetical protein
LALYPFLFKPPTALKNREQKTPKKQYNTLQKSSIISINTAIIIITIMLGHIFSSTLTSSPFFLSLPSVVSS